MADGKALGREALLAAIAGQQLPRERVDVPELGGFVYVRGMTARERDEWERSNVVLRKGRVQTNMDHLGNARARLAVRCLCDEQGVRLFGDGDAEILGGLRADVASRIFAIAQRLSDVTEADLEELKKTSDRLAVGDGSSSA